MGDHDEVSIEQQLADLAALKRESRRRESLRRGSPEWLAASEAERRAADRIRDWTRPFWGSAERRGTADHRR